MWPIARRRRPQLLCESPLQRLTRWWRRTLDLYAHTAGMDPEAPHKLSRRGDGPRPDDPRREANLDMTLTSDDEVGVLGDEADPGGPRPD
jgi:hypothetical protein